MKNHALIQSRPLSSSRDARAPQNGGAAERGPGGSHIGAVHIAATGVKILDRPKSYQICFLDPLTAAAFKDFKVFHYARQEIWNQSNSVRGL